MRWVDERLFGLQFAEMKAKQKAVARDDDVPSSRPPSKTGNAGRGRTDEVNPLRAPLGSCDMSHPTCSHRVQ